MRGYSTIVFNNQTLLNDLLGVNYQNIDVFEEILGVKIFIRGNEIFLETENKKIKGDFERLVNELTEYVRNGHYPDPALIKTVHDSLGSEEIVERQHLRVADKSVIIPNGLKKVFPRSRNQKRYLESIESYELVFGIGPAGTGKTYLAVAEALKYILNRSVRKLVLTRPVVEAGEKLGFLPGDLESKINPYLRPLYDAMEALIPYEVFKRMEETKKIEIVPLAYMRGRTLSDSFIILDEAQNTTREQMKMFLTRIGENSKTVITGDITQIDLPKQKQSGLLHVIDILRGIDEVDFVFFDQKDVVRNELVKKIIHAYEKADGTLDNEERERERE